MNVCLIITAGGRGKRFGSDLPKQFHKLSEVPLIIRTINAFADITDIKSMVITTPSEHLKLAEEIITEYMPNKPFCIIEGGNERQDSVYNALKSEYAQKSDMVIIHDSVRPFVSVNLIKKLINAAREIGGAIPSLNLKDTVRELKSDGSAVTLDRTKLRVIQTPQIFRTNLLIKAYENALSNNFYSTDDAALFEYSGLDFVMLEGDSENIKITNQDDLEFAE